MSNRQHAILRWIRANGPITVQTATNVFGGHYYTNAAFHTGNTLRRMVANGSLVRVKRGVYGLAPQRAEKCGLCGNGSPFLAKRGGVLLCRGCVENGPETDFKLT